MSSYPRRLILLASSVGLGSLIGCVTPLPDDFGSLGMEDKLMAYEAYRRSGGRELLRARSEIAWHGYPAAELMLQYLSEGDQSIGAEEALRLIEEVQLRGCSLRGTAVERAVSEFSKTAFVLGEGISSQAAATLESIETDRTLGSRLLGAPPGGPCEQFSSQSEIERPP